MPINPNVTPDEKAEVAETIVALAGSILNEHVSKKAKDENLSHFLDSIMYALNLMTAHTTQDLLNVRERAREMGIPDKNMEAMDLILSLRNFIRDEVDNLHAKKREFTNPLIDATLEQLRGH